MKLSARDADGYFARPDPDKTGILIFGADAMRVALKRQQVIGALVGPSGEEEMRLVRLQAGELRKDPAALLDAIKSPSFFAGPRVVFVQDAGDGLAKTIANALSQWLEGDAQIVVTAAGLPARSGLRKLFEGHKNAYCVGIYDDPPSRAALQAELERARIGELDSDAMHEIVALSQTIGPSELRQTLEKLSLYKTGDKNPTTAQDVQAIAPATIEVALDDVLNCVAEARAGDISPVLRKLAGQGVQPVGLCIGASRYFRTLHAAACDPGGPVAHLSRVRPPVFGARRDRMGRQAQSWGVARLERAIKMLTDADLSLRSASRAPQMAMIERTLIRLAMLGKR
ncbi:MAG: DNA polymerase III subunit delta [Paracoccaceae bacterium]